ncbi:nuclear transport factor 2 family protein [Streptomyces sp. NBC_00859]|uniref:nuclear transport factor 2 family protein n=1 Tax=Streptomyces sp. NBC_00859 TaxID=2903682 RepID=UPI0038639CF1|nr:nuclear transport factor 2 family protein [Streptomyces sp. NBC_00859]
MSVDHTEPVRPAAHAMRFAALYAEIQQFYAHQMQLFDRHDSERWAATFTNGAVFVLPALDAPVCGRAALAASVRGNRERQERDGTQLRHWIGMLDVDVRPDGTLRTCAYALVYATPRGGTPVVSRVFVMRDELVGRCGAWHVRHRVVSRDGLPEDGSAQGAGPL